MSPFGVLVVAVWLSWHTTMADCAYSWPLLPKALSTNQNYIIQGMTVGNESLLTFEASHGKQTVNISTIVANHNVTVDSDRLPYETLYAVSEYNIAILLLPTQQLFLRQLAPTKRLNDFNHVCTLANLVATTSTRQTTLLNLASSFAIVQLPADDHHCYCKIFLHQRNGCDPNLKASTTIPCDCAKIANVPETVIGHKDIIISKVDDTIYKYHIPSGQTQTLPMSGNSETSLVASLTSADFVFHQACSPRAINCATIVIAPFVLANNVSWSSAARSISNVDLPASATIKTIASCGDSVRNLAYAVSYLNGTTPTLELRVLQQGPMAKTYTSMQTLVIKSAPDQHDQLQLVCDLEQVTYMFINTTDQWSQHTVNLFDGSFTSADLVPSVDIIHMVPSSASELHPVIDRTVTSTSNVDGTSPVTTQSQSYSDVTTMDTSSITPPQTARMTRSDMQLSLWLGLSLGAAAICSLLTAYCCWQRQLRNKSFVYHQLRAFHNESMAEVDEANKPLLDDEEECLYSLKPIGQNPSRKIDLDVLASHGDAVCLEQRLSDEDELTPDRISDLVATACRHDQPRTLATLLTKLPPNFPFSELDARGLTPFHWACAVNSVECIQILLGSHPHGFLVLTGEGNNALQVCVQHGNKEALVALFESEETRVFLMVFNEDPVTTESLSDYAHRVGDTEVIQYVDAIFDSILGPGETLFKAKRRTAARLCMRRLRAERAHEDATLLSVNA